MTLADLDSDESRSAMIAADHDNEPHPQGLPVLAVCQRPGGRGGGAMKYRVTFRLPVEVFVIIEARAEDDAADVAWEAAQEYLQTLTPSSHLGARVGIDADLDGIGADTVEELPTDAGSTTVALLLAALFTLGFVGLVLVGQGVVCDARDDRISYCEAYTPTNEESS